MNWKPRLLVYLLLWLGFGIACSAMLGKPDFEDETHGRTLWIVWALLPFFLFVGLNDALGPWHGGFSHYTYAFGLLLAAHGWCWFTTKRMGVLVTLYWMFLVGAVLGTWGLRKY